MCALIGVSATGLSKMDLAALQEKYDLDIDLDDDIEEIDFSEKVSEGLFVTLLDPIKYTITSVLKP